MSERCGKTWTLWLPSLCASIWHTPERWHRGQTILPYLYWVFFCPYAFASSLFTHPMTQHEYLTIYFGSISLTNFILFKQRNTCCSSFARLVAYFGSPCASYISAVATMYVSFSLRRILFLQFFFSHNNNNHLSRYFPLNIYNRYDVPKVLQRSTFQWWEGYIKGSP